MIDDNSMWYQQQLEQQEWEAEQKKDREYDKWSEQYDKETFEQQFNSIFERQEK
jgi:hypothetical protein